MKQMADKKLKISILLQEVKKRKMIENVYFIREKKKNKKMKWKFVYLLSVLINIIELMIDKKYF